jgi:DNA-binding FadR family transcriptional regulator
MEMKKLGPIPKTQISNEVTLRLESYIVENKLTEGDKLPSERELADTLGVGTRIIREVLQRLQTRGIIEIVHGKGSFVVNRDVEAYVRHLVGSFRFVQPEEDKLLLELSYVRQIIETAAVEESVRHIDAKTVTDLETTLAKQAEAEQNGDVELYNNLDLEFHRTIVNSNGNKLLSALYEHLRELLIQTVEKTGYLRGSMSQSYKDHTQILDFIRSGDPIGAKSALYSHLAHTATSIRNIGNGGK